MLHLFRRSNRSVILLVACCTTLAAAISEATYSYVNWAFGKRYDVSFSDNDLKNTPTWNDDDENPPLSARKAIQLADAMRAKLVEDGDGYKWKRVSAAICFLDMPGCCVWEILYEPKSEGDSTGPESSLRVFVMMDGTVLQPRISKALVPGL